MLKASIVCITSATFGLLLAAPVPSQAQSDPQPSAVWGNGPDRFLIATGSPGELGLLERIATTFAAAQNATVVWYKAGSGEAMRLLKERKVDMVMAHAPAAERTAVAEGWATGRRPIGSNEFWIVGPASDPAGIARAKDATEAFRLIHAAKAKFITRADKSGTHQKEMAIWKSAGIEPGGETYIATRAFMTESLQRAEKAQGYFLTDSSTFVAERGRLPGLKLLFRGGETLLNPYHTLWLADPTPGQPTAKRFAEFLYGDVGQAMFREFGKTEHGEAMYNDAAITAKLMPPGT